MQELGFVWGVSVRLEVPVRPRKHRDLQQRTLKQQVQVEGVQVIPRKELLPVRGQVPVQTRRQTNH